MNYLIDTHILIWHEEGNSHLKPEFRKLIEEARETIWVRQTEDRRSEVRRETQTV